jgi:Peptidase inhibitor family I36
MRLRALFTLGFSLLFAIGLAAAPAAAGAPATTVGVPTSIDQSAGHRPASFPDITVLDTGCADLRLCIWDQANYGGSKLVFSGSDQGWWTTNFTIRSAKNHFDNRAVGFYNINTGERVRCLNPNTNKPGPFPDATRVLYIGVLGSRC